MSPTIFLVPFLFLLLLLLVPIDVEGGVVLGKRPYVRIVWLFGLIRKDLLDETGSAKEPFSEEHEQLQERETREPPAQATKKEPAGNGQRWSIRDVLSIIRTEGLIGNLKRLLKGLVGALRVRHLRARLRMGFEDPADTGQVAGYLWSAIGYLESLYSFDVKIEPLFCEEAMEGEGNGALRIWPALVVLPLLRFSLSRPTLQATWKAIKITSGKNK